MGGGKKKMKKLFLLLVAAFLVIWGSYGGKISQQTNSATQVHEYVQAVTKNIDEQVEPSGTLKDVYLAGKNVPDYNGHDYYLINRNVPFFSKSDLNKKAGTIKLSEMDAYGRCRSNFMIVGPETLPHVPREGIGMVRPSGWRTIRYDFIENRYLYNRSHLLGYQLSGLNAERRNLITGTEYFNKRLMLPYENRVAETAKRGFHIAYRVTPIYKERELVARGVIMEGYSIEDSGRLHFNVFVYNIEPGVVINYENGDSYAQDDAASIAEKKAIEKSIRRHYKHKKK